MDRVMLASGAETYWDRRVSFFALCRYLGNFASSDVTPEMGTFERDLRHRLVDALPRIGEIGTSRDQC